MSDARPIHQRRRGAPLLAAPGRGTQTPARSPSPSHPLTPSPHHLLILPLLLLLLLLSPAPAAAQTREGLDPDISVEFGFNGAVVTGRWTPMTVWVQGGAEPFEGQLIVSYAQDDAQTAVLTRAVTATPGRRVPVHLLLHLGPQTKRIAISLRDFRGRRVRAATFAEMPRRRELTLPFVSGQIDLIVLGVASRAEDISSLRWIAHTDRNKSAVRILQVARPTIHPSELPPASAAYDGVLAVVARGDSAPGADPRALAAVREWVAAGGRLVIIAEAPGDAWREWLPPGPQGDLVQVSPSREVALPADLVQHALDAAPEAIAPAWKGAFPQGEAEEEAGEDDSGAEESASREEDAAQPPDSAELGPVMRAARPIRLTQTARRTGWTQRWMLEDGSGESLLAEGPVGFGWVVVLALDARTAAPQVSGEQITAVWSSVFENAASDFLAVADNFGAAHIAGATTHAVHASVAGVAVNSSLDRVAQVPPAGGGAFVLVILGGITLAMLVGPVDALALRRLRLRHRSWLTAIAWVALAALIAHQGPRLIRSSDTIVARVECIDVLAAAPGRHESFGFAASAGLTGIFSGQTQVARLLDDNADGWWAGVSIARNYAYEQDAPRQMTLPLAQRGPSTMTASLADPWGGFLPGDGASTEPLDLRLNLWTFRALRDQARVLPPITAVADADGVITLTGLSEHVQKDAWVRMGEQWYRATLVAEGGAHRIERAPEPVGIAPVEWRAGHLEREPNQYGWYGGTSEPFQPRHALVLPGADRRIMAIDAMARSGRFAVLYLREDQPDSSTPGGRGVLLPEAVYRATRTYRIAVPLPDAEGEEEENQP